MVKTALVFVGLFLLAAASAQQNDEPRPKGVIYGIAIGQDGQPAKQIGLTAEPLGVGLGAVLPHTRTNDVGEYRFENVPWWGRYTVYGEDENEGYSSFSTGPAGDSTPPEVELTPEHPEAELRVLLPPRAGFIPSSSDQPKNGCWNLGDASRIEAAGKPCLAILHDELLLKPRHSDTARQGPSADNLLRW